MYNLVRNTTFAGLSVYSTTFFIGDTTNAVICGLVFSAGVLLCDTLFGLSKHQTNYQTLRKSVGGSKLDSFDDDGAHLPSMYSFLKTNVCADLIEKKKYLGDNKNLFERPYRFINDTKNIVNRVLSEMEYIKKVPDSAFKEYNGILFSNDRTDHYKKTRAEFYISNMEACPLRDELIGDYRNKYGDGFNIQTSEELKLVAERNERLKNLPDHLNSEIKF